MYMPRSIQDMLDHADELARQFEDYEPTPSDERPVAEYQLQRAVIERARGERHLTEAIETARAGGMSWAKIAKLLGTSTQAAQQRYGTLSEHA